MKGAYTISRRLFESKVAFGHVQKKGAHVNDIYFDFIDLSVLFLEAPFSFECIWGPQDAKVLV